MKPRILLAVLSCFSLVTLGSCGGSTSSSSGGHSYAYEYNYSSTTYVSSEQKIINHLNSRGTGEYHQVICASYSSNGDSVLTSLGYKDGSFFMANDRYGSSISGIFAFMIKFGASSGTGMYTIEYNNKEYFRAYETVYIKNHAFSSVDVTSVPTCLFSDDAIESIGSLNGIAIRNMLTDVNSYLLNNNLSYIY